MSILENSDIGTFSADNDKTITMSRELAESLLTEATNQNWSDLNILLNAPSDSSECRCRRFGKNNPHWPCPVHPIAAPIVERQDGSALMKIAADLANRHPLRQLYLVCEHQGRINTDSLHEHLDKCGDLLACIALDIRRAIVSPPAPVAAVLPERKPEGSWVDDGSGYASEWDEDLDAQGWNACLDKVKELNQ